MYIDSLTVWLEPYSGCAKVKVGYSRLQQSPPLRKLTCHMGSHSVICHPAELIFQQLPQPIKARTRFSDPRGMQGWVSLVDLVIHRGGIPARRRCTRLGTNWAQVRSCDEQRYHCAKPPTAVCRDVDPYGPGGHVPPIFMKKGHTW